MRYSIWICFAVIAMIAACSSAPPKDEETSPDLPVPMAPKDTAQKRSLTTITMSYHNDASTLNMSIDPYDENLHIEMKRNAKTVADKPVALPTPPPPAPAKKDTVYMMQQAPQTTTIMAPQPTSVNVQLQLPPEKRDTTRQQVPAVAPAEPAPARIDSQLTNEIIADIRRAQEYFYKQDYSSALRLLKASQDKHPTAEAFALQGSVYYMLGDRTSARHYWNEALRINPQMTEVVEALSKLDQSQGAQ